MPEVGRHHDAKSALRCKPKLLVGQRPGAAPGNESDTAHRNSRGAAGSLDQAMGGGRMRIHLGVMCATIAIVAAATGCGSYSSPNEGGSSPSADSTRDSTSSPSPYLQR